LIKIAQRIIERSWKLGEHAGDLALGNLHDRCQRRLEIRKAYGLGLSDGIRGSEDVG